MFKAALVAFGLSTCLPTVVQAQEEPKARLPSMTVEASATREVVPDTAFIYLSVSSERPTASEAAEETARASQAVLAELKAQDLSPRDLNNDVTVSPVYEEQHGDQGQRVTRKLRGYVARNALTVWLSDTSRAGALARKLIDKGANVFDGIYFTVSDRRGRMDELRVEATREAVRRAKLYAEAAGIHLGRVLTFDPDSDGRRGDEASIARAPPPIGKSVVATVIPVEPGVEEISARVSMTWELLP